MFSLGICFASSLRGNNKMQFSMLFTLEYTTIAGWTRDGKMNSESGKNEEMKRLFLINFYLIKPL